MKEIPDDTRCVVLLRERPSKEWDLCYIAVRKSLAWRTAAMLEDDERREGNKGAKSIVVTEEDYYHGRIKELRPPKGFHEEMARSARVDSLSGVKGRAQSVPEAGGDSAAKPVAAVLQTASGPVQVSQPDPGSDRAEPVAVGAGDGAGGQPETAVPVEAGAAEDHEVAAGKRARRVFKGEDTYEM